MSGFHLLQLLLILFQVAKEMRIDINVSSYNYCVITETLKEGWKLMSMYFIALFHSIKYCNLDDHIQLVLCSIQPFKLLTTELLWFHLIKTNISFISLWSTWVCGLFFLNHWISWLSCPFIFPFLILLIQRLSIF